MTTMSKYTRRVSNNVNAARGDTAWREQWKLGLKAEFLYTAGLEGDALLVLERGEPARVNILSQVCAQGDTSREKLQNIVRAMQAQAKSRTVLAELGIDRMPT